MEEIKEIISEDPPPIDTDTPEVDVPESEDEGEGEPYISFRDEKYKDGDSIVVAYDTEITDFAFLLKEYPKEAVIEWQVLFLGTDYTAKYAQNEVIYDNFGINTGETKRLTIVANYNDEKITVEFIRESEEYQLEELWAIHRETRKAKSGETLYVLEDSEEPVNLKIDTDSKISTTNLNNITWYKTNTEVQNIFDQNKTSLTLPNSEKNKIKYLVEVGNPLSLKKDVDVEWFEKDYSKTKVTIGSGSNSFVKKALELTELTKKYSEKLDKIPFIRRARKNENISNGIGFYFDIIPFQKTLENIEDQNSRLYYTKKTIVGGFDVGLSGTTKWTVFGIPYEKIPGPKWIKDKAQEYVVAEVYVSATAKAGGELKAKQIEHKFVESNRWENISSGVDPALIKLDVALEAGAEFSLLKGDTNRIKKDDDEFQWFTLHGSARGTANAELLSIGWVAGKDPDVYFLRKGVWIDIKTNLYAIVIGKKIEAEPFYEKVEIIPPVNN